MGIKISQFQVGKSGSAVIKEAIDKAMTTGDWVLIENLYLADDWIFALELIIAKLDKDNCNSKFRLWLSSV